MNPASRNAPLVPGLPLLGSALAAAGDAARFFSDSHQAHGPVFRVSYPGRTMTMLAGLEANRLFAVEGARVFSAPETYARVTREFGTDQYPNAQEGQRHHQLRQLLAPSLSAMAVEPFTARLLELCRERGASWPVGPLQRAGRAVAPLVSDAVSVCTSGQPIGDRLHRDIDLWATMMGVVAVGGVLPEFTLYLPPIRRARRRFTDFLEAQLDAHGGGPGFEREPDVLDALLAAQSRLGLDRRALLAMAMVPQKNAGIYLYRLLSFALFELLRRDPLRETVLGEIDSAFTNGTPTLAELRRLRTLQGVILESLRLYPLALALPRVVAAPFEFAGFDFAAGEVVYIVGPATHFDPAYFPEPRRFDPDRFSLQRCEHRRPHVFAPFGLGHHACAARGYSQAMVTVLLAGLLRSTRLEIEAIDADLRLRAFPNPIPEARFRFRSLGPRTPPAAVAAPPSGRERISTALWQLTPERRDAVFAGLSARTLAAGTVVFRQGDEPDCFYVIRRGEMEVVLEEPGEEPRVMARLGPGDHFGEIGLLQRVARTATVRAATEAIVLVLEREAFDELVVEADLTRQELVQLVERRAMATSLARALPDLDTEEVGRLASVCTRRTFAAGETIIREGDAAESFYVLARGRVELLVHPPSGPDLVIAHLDAVDFFGEVGLLQGRPRTATVRAVDGPATVLEIPRERFEEMVAESGATRDDLARVAGQRLLSLATAGPPRPESP